MIKRILFFISAFIVLINSPYILAEELERGLWVWKSDTIMADEGKMDKFFKFIEAPHGNASKKINVVYMDPYGNLKTDIELYKTFIRKASQRGIKIEYMTGNANWVNQHTTPLKKLEAVIAYNESVEPQERFYGIHWDIEGHTLPVFRQKKYKETILRKYIEFLEKCRDKIDASGASLRLAVDLPTFYDVDYFTKVCEYADCVVLMDYRDSYNRIFEDAQSAIDAGNRKEKKIIIGVETQIPNTKWGVTPPITFYEEGYVKMEEVLDKVTNNLSSLPSFGGIAIHYYTSYINMTKEGKELIETIKYPTLDEIECIFTKGINIDGTISKNEWRFSPSLVIDTRKFVVYGQNTWKDKDDLSATVWTAWDEDNLYFAVKVIDDRLVQNATGKDLLNGDHIEIWVDADYQTDIDSPAPNKDDFQIGFSPGNFSGVSSDMIVWYPDTVKLSEAKKTIKYAFKQTDNGYNLEACLPWSFLGVSEMKNGTKLRVNIDPSDTDDSDDQECLMSTSSHRKLGNPRTFRTLVLKQ